MVRAASVAVAFLPSCCRTQGPSWKFFEPSSPEKVEHATGNTWHVCSWPVPFHKSKRNRLKTSPEDSIPGLFRPEGGSLSFQALCSYSVTTVTVGGSHPLLSLRRFLVCGAPFSSIYVAKRCVCFRVPTCTTSSRGPTWC